MENTNGSVTVNLSADNHTLTSNQLFFYYGVSPLFIANILVGLPTNVYVVWLIGRGAGGPAATDLFVLNLAVSEILSCILSFYLLNHFLQRISREVGLQVLQLTLQLMLMSRPIFQSCICLERYMAVVHPTVFLRFKPLRYRLACCVVIWLLILLYSIVPTFTLSIIQSIYLLICTSMFFLVVTIYSSVHVLCVLKLPGPGEGDRDHEGRNGFRRKAFKVIMITLVFTTSTQALRVFILGPTLLYGSEPLSLMVILICLSISIFTGFLIPLLYLHRAGKLPCIKF